jgi:hypothetical protein
MALQDVQSRTTSTEFNEWCQFMRQDLEEPRRDELYFAQLTAEVVRFSMTVRDPKLVKAKDFIIPFVTETEKPQMDVGARMTMSKQFWHAVVACPQTPKEQ